MAHVIDGHFKRLNFFRGFRTTEADWNDSERYHVDKRKLHNQMLHSPGVVGHVSGGLRVGPRGRGELAVEVQPGVALDGQGHDIIVVDATVVPFQPAEFRLPGTVYLVARYVEEFTDFVAYKENLDFKGHRRITESAVVAWTMVAPEVATDVELCRVAVSKDVRRIMPAKNPRQPGTDEIDTRFVPHAGVTGSWLPPQTREQLLEVIVQSKPAYALMSHKLGIAQAGDVLHALTTLEMLVHTAQVDVRNFFPLHAIVLDHQSALVAILEAEHPELSLRREFATYKKHWEMSVQRHEERHFAVEVLLALVESQREMVAFLQTLLERPRPGVAQAQTQTPETQAAIEAIKVRSATFEKELRVEGLELVLVDQLDPLDVDSERAHKWTISGERDKYRTRQKLKYPDGVVVEDAGVAFEGGELAFELAHLEPGRDLYIIWRTDYVHGEWEAEMIGNGRRLPNAVCAGNDRKFRWRNWVYVIAAEHVREVTMSILCKPVTAGRDLNIFKLWAYQPMRRG